MVVYEPDIPPLSVPHRPGRLKPDGSFVISTHHKSPTRSCLTTTSTPPPPSFPSPPPSTMERSLPPRLPPTSSQRCAGDLSRVPLPFSPLELTVHAVPGTTARHQRIFRLHYRLDSWACRRRRLAQTARSPSDEELRGGVRCAVYVVRVPGRRRTGVGYQAQQVREKGEGEEEHQEQTGQEEGKDC